MSVPVFLINVSKVDTLFFELLDAFSLSEMIFSLSVIFWLSPEPRLFVKKALYCPEDKLIDGKAVSLRCIV